MNAKRDPVSLVPLYNFIARHQSPARVTFGIKYQLHTVHQLTKLTSLVRGVIDPFSGTNFLFVPINTSRSGGRRAESFRSDTNERLQTTNEGRKGPNRRDLYCSPRRVASAAPRVQTKPRHSLRGCLRMRRKIGQVHHLSTSRGAMVL